MYPTTATCSLHPSHRCHLLFLGLSLICLRFHVFRVVWLVSSNLLSRRLKFNVGVQHSGVTSGGLVAVVRSCQLCSAFVYVRLL